MRPILRSRAKTTTCIERWIPPARRSIFCSPPGVMPQLPTVLPKGSELSRQSRAAGDQRGQAPSFSAGSGSAKRGRRAATASSPASVQIPEQCGGTGPSHGKEADLAGEGYGSFASAWRTLQGIEAWNMIRKGRVRWVAKGDSLGQAALVAELFGLAA